MERSALSGEQNSQDSASAAVQAWLQGADLDSPLVRSAGSQGVFKAYEKTTDTGKLALEKIGKDQNTLEDWSKCSAFQRVLDPYSQLKAPLPSSPLLTNPVFGVLWRRLTPLLSLQLLPEPGLRAFEEPLLMPLSIHKKRVIARRRNPPSRPLLKNLSNYSSVLSSEAASPAFRPGSLAESPQLTISFDTHFSHDPGTSRSVPKRQEPTHYKRLSIPDKPLLPPLVQQRTGRTPARPFVRFSLPQDLHQRKSLKAERENRPRAGRSVLRGRRSPGLQRSFPRPRHP